MAKVSDFNKQELIDHMRASREIHRPDTESKAWERAFKLYKEETKQPADMDCSGCWKRVREWLTA